MKLAGLRAIFWPLVSAGRCLLMLSIVLLAGRSLQDGGGALPWMIVAGILADASSAMPLGPASDREKLIKAKFQG